jgi:hypothetical protein
MNPQWAHYATHCELIGAPQVGKTSCLTYWNQRNILAGNRLIKIVGGKDDSFDSLVAFIAHACPDYPAKFINVSDGWGAGWNPFLVPPGRSLSAHVSALATYVTPEGERFESRFPEEETAECFFAHLALSQEPVWEAMRLLRYENRKSWIGLVPEEYDYQARAIAGTDAKGWEYKTGALRRFLRPFVTSDAIRRMLTTEPVFLSDLYRDGISLFIKASPSGILSAPAGKAALSFFLAELFQVGTENAGKHKTYFVDLDEPHLFVPPTIGDMLTTITSAGFLMTVAHHHSEQFDEKVREAISVACGIKVIMGGLPPKARLELVDIAYGAEMAQDHHRQPRISHITEYEDDIGTSETESEYGKSQTVADRLRPYAVEVQTGWEDYTPEQIRLKLAETLKLPKRHALAILPDKTQKFEIPDLDEYLPDSPEYVKFIASHRHAPSDPPKGGEVASDRQRARPRIFDAEG